MHLALAIITRKSDTARGVEGKGEGGGSLSELSNRPTLDMTPSSYIEAEGAPSLTLLCWHFSSLGVVVVVEEGGVRTLQVKRVRQ